MKFLPQTTRKHKKNTIRSQQQQFDDVDAEEEFSDIISDITSVGGAAASTASTPSKRSKNSLQKYLTSSIPKKKKSSSSSSPNLRNNRETTTTQQQQQQQQQPFPPVTLGTISPTKITRSSNHFKRPSSSLLSKSQSLRGSMNTTTSSLHNTSTHSLHSNNEMEYSTIHHNKSTFIVRECNYEGGVLNPHAVGAAATAVEYGVGTDFFIGEVDLDPDIGNSKSEGNKEEHFSVKDRIAKEQGRIASKEQERIAYMKNTRRGSNALSSHASSQNTYTSSLENISSTIDNRPTRINNNNGRAALDSAGSNDNDGHRRASLEVIKANARKLGKDRRASLSSGAISSNTSSNYNNNKRSSSVESNRPSRRSFSFDEDESNEPQCGLMCSNTAIAKDDHKYDGSYKQVRNNSRSNQSPRNSSSSSLGNEENVEQHQQEEQEQEGEKRESNYKEENVMLHHGNIPHSKSFKDVENKKDLGLTVVAVQSTLVPGRIHQHQQNHQYDDTNNDKKKSYEYKINSTQFDPKGCIWDAVIGVYILCDDEEANTLHEEKKRKTKYLDFPLQIECCVDEEKEGMAKVFVDISLHEKANLKWATSHANMIQVGMEWIQRAIQRSIRREIELLCNDDVRLSTPNVSIHLPPKSVGTPGNNIMTNSVSTGTQTYCIDDHDDTPDLPSLVTILPSPNSLYAVKKKNSCSIQRPQAQGSSKSSTGTTAQMTATTRGDITTESLCSLPSSGGSPGAVPEDVIKNMRRSENAYSGELRMAKQGLLSQKSFRRFSSDETHENGIEEEEEKRLKQRGSNSTLDISDHSAENVRLHSRGLMSQKSLQRHFQMEEKEKNQKHSISDAMKGDHRPEDEILMARKGSANVLHDMDSNRSEEEEDEGGEDHQHHDHDLTEGELRLAMKGCLSRKSMVNFRRKGLLKRNLSVTFSETGSQVDGSQVDVVSEKTKKIQATIADMKNNGTPTAAVGNGNGNDPDIHKKESQDILTEGQYFLGVSMLVYMYSHLRETCRMGHTRCKMENIDVYSLQSQYLRDGIPCKYLESTKTAGSIIRVVIDELDQADENDEEENDIIGDENKEYEQSITAQFRTWIEDSRINQIDEETQNIIAEMKRKVARQRWKRAILAVRLSYKLSGGKPPSWPDGPVAAPGCENQNRFVDMNAMVGEQMRKQPKYFREGSVMHNLIESGIELVWFSDMSQNDVVYGICVQREEKKVTVVFRGTVNAHNWKMNLKFDTNEYRNPVKQNYPGRVDELSLHSGFALYLLRKRKDTGISKLQEIFDKIDEIGKEMAPDGNYKLCITGHSLGGALATLCGFYVAARSRFAHLSTIYVWTFAAPRVGTKAFIHAWQHLEKTGRIRFARFSSTQDLVPLVPFCNFEANDLQFYKHVGMRVQLHGTGRIGKWRIQRNLDVTYPLKHDWLSEIRRMLMNNILVNLTTPSELKNNHNLTSIQKRLHFTMSYKKALGSGVLFSDKRRNRIKTLDEYYHIRAKITSDSIAQEIIEQSKPSSAPKQSSRMAIVLLVMLLLLTWLFLILSVTTDVFEKHPISPQTLLLPFSFLASGINHMIHLPVALPMAAYEMVSSQVGRTLSSILPHGRDGKRTAFVGKPYNVKLNGLIDELAIGRAKQYYSIQHSKALVNAQDAISNEGTLKILDSTTQGLFRLAALVDNGSNAQLTIATPKEVNSQRPILDENVHDDGGDQPMKGVMAALQATESQLKPLQEYATGITFAPKLEGMYLVGVGVRKKSILKIYGVAMYSSAVVLDNAISSKSLLSAAHTFDESTPSTVFVLEMVYVLGAEKMADAIADGVKPRYDGSSSDISFLQSLIVDAVNSIGGQTPKGTIFRFDCSEGGVSVAVNGNLQGTAEGKGLGSAFVDIFMDQSTVSPTLVDNCIETWSKAKDLSSKLVELSNMLGNDLSMSASEQDGGQEAAKDSDDKIMKQHAIESHMKPLQDYATGITFEPRLEGMYLVGVGVRKKSVIKIYGVAMYSSSALIETLSHLPPGKHQRNDASKSLHSAARIFNQSTLMTSFVLKMVYVLGAEKMADAIADGIKPRYGGSASDVNELQSLIVDAVNSIGGQASKGTVFRFDCSEEGVNVIVNGKLQGTAKGGGLGSAFVDVFMDENAVSPTLVDSCLDTWTGVDI